MKLSVTSGCSWAHGRQQPERATRRTAPVRAKVPPVPLGDDLDLAIVVLDGDLVVDGLGRMADAGRPSFRVGHRVLREGRVVQVRKNREVDDPQRYVVARDGRLHRSPLPREASSPCFRRSIPPRRFDPATAAGPQVPTDASSEPDTRHRRLHQQDIRPSGPGLPALLTDAGQRGELQDAHGLPPQFAHRAAGLAAYESPGACGSAHRVSV